MNQILLFVFAAVLFLLILGCEETRPFGDMPDITWEGNRIRVGTTESYLPCKGELEAADDSVTKLEKMLYEYIPENKKIRVYYIPNDWESSPCPSDAAGCAAVFEGEYYVFLKEFYSVRHEIVHLVLNGLDSPHKIFEEGFAYCYGSLSRYSSLSWSISLEDVNSLLIDEMWSISHYVSAGMLVCYWIEQFGLDKIKEIAKKSAKNWIREDFNKNFKNILGIDFDTAADLVINDDQKCHNVPFACDDEKKTTNTDGSFEHMFLLDCSQNSTTGPFEGIGWSPTNELEEMLTIYSSALVELSRPGSYRLCATNSDFPKCVPDILSRHYADVYASVIEDFEAEYFDYNQFYQSIEIVRAECSSGPGCYKSSISDLDLSSLTNYQYSFFPGYGGIIHVSTPGLYQIDSYLNISESNPYGKTEDISFTLSPCIGDGDKIEYECDSTKSLVCGTNECRICNSLTVEMQTVQETDADTDQQEETVSIPKACIECRCEPNGF